jgi:hypothetical protein
VLVSSRLKPLPTGYEKIHFLYEPIAYNSHSRSHLDHPVFNC